MPENTRKSMRDPEATRRRILDAAEQEFAEHGLSGARVDTIAGRTETNVRMIYYYFSSKTGLYRTVLERAYGRMRAAEHELSLDRLDPVAAIRGLTEFTFDYQAANPEFVRLVAIENIHHAVHLREMPPIRAMNASVIITISGILDRGKRAGLFRADAEPIGVHLLMTALCFFRVSNRYTLRTVFPVDPLDPSLHGSHRRMLVDAVLGYLGSGAVPVLQAAAPSAGDTECPINQS